MSISFAKDYFPLTHLNKKMMHCWFISVSAYWARRDYLADAVRMYQSLSECLSGWVWVYNDEPGAASQEEDMRQGGQEPCPGDTVVEL